MTREEVDKIASDYLNDCESELDMLEVFVVAKEALEQEPILGKIRAEIKQEPINVSGCIMKHKVLSIIDRYREGEQKGENNGN